MVLLVTLSRGTAAGSTTAFTAVLAMFVVAYMAYIANALMFAHLTPDAGDSPFDLQSAQYALATTNYFFSIFIGWFALRPLFDAFELRTMASLIGWLLGPAVVAGALLVAFTLYRTGFIGGRIFVTMPLIGFAASGGYGLAVAVFAPSVRSPDATLALTVVAFAFGALAISTYSVLPVLGANRHIAPVLARYWHFVVVAHAQGAVCLLGFLLLAVLGLA